MNEDWENGISPAKMRQGVKDLNSRCHCGKLRTRHYSYAEIRKCKAEKATESVVRRMTDKEINNMKQAKI